MSNDDKILKFCKQNAHTHAHTYTHLVKTCKNDANQTPNILSLLIDHIHSRIHNSEKLHTHTPAWTFAVWYTFTNSSTHTHTFRYCDDVFTRMHMRRDTSWGYWGSGDIHQMYIRVGPCVQVMLWSFLFWLMSTRLRVSPAGEDSFKATQRENIIKPVTV